MSTSSLAMVWFFLNRNKIIILVIIIIIIIIIIIDMTVPSDRNIALKETEKNASTKT